jgi:hypothetical protein
MNIGIGSATLFNTYQSRLIVSDSFDRPDNNTSLLKTDNGLTWTPVNGTWGISGNKATSISKVHNDIVSIQSLSGSLVVYCSVKGTIANATTFSVPSIIPKFIDGSNFIQITFSFGNSIVLNKKDADVFTTLSTKGVTLQDNIEYKFKIEFSDTSIKVYMDGSLVIDYTLSTDEKTKFLPASKSAIRLQRQNTPTLEATFDNFVVEKL